MIGTQLVIGRDQLMGVEAQQQANGWRFHWIHLRRGKSGVRVLRQGTAENMAELTETVGTRVPLVLVASSDRYLLRELEGRFDAERDLAKLLPNVQAGSVLIDAIEREGRSSLCIARKQLTEPLIEELTNAGFRVTELHLGHIIGSALKDLAGDDGSLGPLNFRCHEGVVAPTWNEEKIPGAVMIGDERIEGRCLLAFAACWQAWFRPLERTSPEMSQVTTARREERSRVIYERGGLAAMAFLLILLGADVGLRQHMSTGKASRQQAVEERGRENAEMAALEQSLDARKRLMTATGTDAHGRVVRIIDQVAAGTPMGVQLSELWFAPAKDHVRDGEGFERKADVILISGRTMDPAHLAGWVADLKTIDGVRNARLLSVEQDRDLGPLFSIEIELG